MSQPDSDHTSGESIRLVRNLRNAPQSLAEVYVQVDGSYRIRFSDPCTGFWTEDSETDPVPGLIALGYREVSHEDGKVLSREAEADAARADAARAAFDGGDYGSYYDPA